MMLPPWPTTTSNASASHVPIDSSYVPHYFPKKNSVKEGRENIIKQVNMSSKVLKEYSTPPSPRAAMDLKHFDHYNFDDTVNSTCYLPSSKSYQKRGNEAQQTVRKMHDSIHDITGKYPSDLSAKWKKDADEKEQEDEGDFLIRDEEPEEVEELAIRAAERVTELKEEATRIFTQLAETADAVALGRIRARRFLTEFDTTLSRSRGNTGLQLQFASYSRIGRREMLNIEAVPITVYVDLEQLKEDT